jgi:hypothetical protein
MQHLGFIADKSVSSRAEYIILSHTSGVLSEHSSLEQARPSLRAAKAMSASWGHACDAAIFQWSGFDWRPVDTLYDEDAYSYASGGDLHGPAIVWP